LLQNSRDLHRRICPAYRPKPKLVLWKDTLYVYFFLRLLHPTHSMLRNLLHHCPPLTTK
jgi:hypothetical protein